MTQRKEKYRHWLWQSPYAYEEERKDYKPVIYPIIEYDMDDIIKALENIKKHHPNGCRIECLISVIEDC